MSELSSILKNCAVTFPSANSRTMQSLSFLSFGGRSLTHSEVMLSLLLFLFSFIFLALQAKPKLSFSFPHFLSGKSRRSSGKTTPGTNMATGRRGKIADAKTPVSDADFAYNLQIQEAIYASLSLHPSALSPSSSSETFKLYCKGVRSQERVRGKNVIVVGVGVAICDSRDNLIFEVSKAFKVDFGEGIVEIGALIEGLNSALRLHLKKVTFFCDDYMVYQYVTGRVQPIWSGISTLLNQVSVLQKKFIYCQPSLVACSDIKFAFKLARDAIVSQITWPVETSKGKRSLKETCIICCEDTDAGKMFSVDGCLHRYCHSCMKQHAEVKLLNGGMDVKCPHEGCKSEVSIHSCRLFLDPMLVDIMSQRKKEASIAVEDKVYCPYPRCSALMSKTEALEYSKNYFTGAENSEARKCIKCCRFFCISCKALWHYKMTCNDYKKSNPPRAEDRMLKSLAQKKHWRQCVKCGHMVELAEGCYHIICRCGYEFCYACGAQWKNKKPTCTCPIWDERYIIRDGRRR